MLLKLNKNEEEIVNALLAEGLITRALDFAVERGVHSLPMEKILQHIEEHHAKTDPEKAAALHRRLVEIKRVNHMLIVV